MYKVDRLMRADNFIYLDSPSFSGIAEGICKGDIWVDNIQSPTIVLVYSYAVGSYSILGNSRNTSIYEHLHSFLEAEIFEDLRENNIHRFDFSVEDTVTESNLLEQFKNFKIESEYEFTYRKTDIVLYESLVSNQYDIVKIDLDLIKKLRTNDFENVGFIQERLLGSWNTYEDFLNNSLGYAVICNKQIVATILGTARLSNILTVDIETDERHRKSGLATKLTEVFVNSCVDSGLIVQWDCVESNLGSQKIAEKADFKLFKKRRYYWVNIG